MTRLISAAAFLIVLGSAAVVRADTIAVVSAGQIVASQSAAEYYFTTDDINVAGIL